jgi:hypothetical protein
MVAHCAAPQPHGRAGNRENNLGRGIFEVGARCSLVSASAQSRAYINVTDTLRSRNIFVAAFSRSYGRQGRMQKIDQHKAL